MNIRYKLIDWSFNNDLWSESIRNALATFGDDLPVILGVDMKTVENWIAQRFTPPYTYPNMTNLLRVCNLLDLDPRDMFCLAGVE